MKRDMDKVRGVLLAIEAIDGPLITTLDMPALGNTENGVEAAEYVFMLHSAGFLEQRRPNVYRLSWAGHEFLDSVRDPEIWRKTKEGAAKVGSLSLKLIGEIALGFARMKAQELGLPLT